MTIRMKNMKHCLCAVLLLCLSVEVLSLPIAQAEEPASAERQPLVVALDGSGQYRSIQEAVDAAKKGDTILIRPGAYAEDVTIHSLECRVASLAGRALNPLACRLSERHAHHVTRDI